MYIQPLNELPFNESPEHCRIHPDMKVARREDIPVDTSHHLLHQPEISLTTSRILLYPLHELPVVSRTFSRTIEPRTLVLPSQIAIVHLYSLYRF